MKSIASDRVSSIARYQLIQMTNARFYNQEYYRNNTPSKMYLDYEKNREESNIFFEDVINFCLQTDVCKSLNLSVTDLMQMDLASYTYVKECVNKALEEKAKVAEKMRAEAAKQNNNNTWAGRHERR